jgi:hypothetical protein
MHPADRLKETYLFICSWVGRWEKPEEQARVSRRSVRQKTGIALADIERDLWEVSTIHGEF